MSARAETTPDATKRVEELGRIILAYSEVTDKLQQSHDRLERTVQLLRQELSEKSRLLERKNRLAALGEMAAGLAHEIRNPLGGIQLYASLLAKDVADRPASAETVRKISGGVKRMEELVGQVLAFTREMSANVQQADLADVVDEAIEAAGGALVLRQVELKIDGPRPMSVRIDPFLVRQALVNLILNATEAMDAGGAIRIAWEPAPEDTRQFRLSVQDNGPGIPHAIMDRIFNPFFTTKDNGTGLGLAIVHRVIEAHDGAITATNVDGGGAKFEVRI